MSHVCIGWLMLFGPLLSVLVVTMWGMLYQCFARDSYLDANGKREWMDMRAHGLVALLILWVGVAIYLII